MTQLTPRTEIRAEALAEPISHYTDAVRWGDLLFISGASPVDGDGNLVGAGDAVEQTRQVLRNIGHVLELAGMGFEHVLKVTVFLVDMEDRVPINAARQEFFGDARPASTLVEVSRLAIEGMRVEIEAIAGLS